MNIASAQATPANSPLSGASAQFTSSSDATSSQPTAPPSTFVSLLATFVEQTAAESPETPGLKGASQTRTNRFKEDKQGNKDQLASLPSQLSTSQTSSGLSVNPASWQTNGALPDTQSMSDSASRQMAGVQDTDAREKSSRSNTDSAYSSPTPFDASPATGRAPIAFALQVKQTAPKGQIEDFPGANTGPPPDASSRKDMPANSLGSSSAESLNADEHTSPASSSQHPDANPRTTSAAHETGSSDADGKPESSTAAKPAADGPQARTSAASTTPDVPQQAEDAPQKTVRGRQSAALEDDPAKLETPVAPDAGLNTGRSSGACQHEPKSGGGGWYVSRFRNSLAAGSEP